MLRRRPLATASAVSLLLSLTIIAIWVGTYDLKPGAGIFLTKNIRVIAFRGEFSIYNWDIPDRGDMTWFGNDPRQAAQFDLAGIYFVDLKSTKLFKSGTFWTLTIPFVHLTAIALLLPLIWLISRGELSLRRHPSPGTFEVIVN